eukprot:628714-Hanusia_phi.AAC.1
MIAISVTVEAPDNSDQVTNGGVEVGGRRCSFYNSGVGSTTRKPQIHCRIVVLLQDIIADGGQIGPISIYYYYVDYYGQSTWRVSVGEMREEEL